MVSIAPREAASFLKAGYASYPIILIYGPDAGLVTERCEQISLLVTGGDRTSVVRIDGDEIAASTGRLADEAYAMTMFGGRRAIWVRVGGKSIQPALQALLSEPPVDAVVVIEAGELRKTNPLRTFLEKTPGAAVLACYAEDTRDVLALADEMAAARGMALSKESRDAIGASLGADRKRSRSELEKLFLYCHG
jgi:DNA polymerase III subunit delta